MVRNLSPALHVALLVLLGIVSLQDVAQAEEPEPDASPTAGTRHFVPVLEVRMDYDRNVFLLDPGKKNDLSAPSSSDRLSGRFSNMESASDLITALRLTGDLKTRGFSGRSLTVTPEVRYDLYARNSERSNLRLDLAATQALPNGGRINLAGRFTPSYFAKNYLANATDLDSSGTISPDERLYRAGTYREGEVALEYRARLVKSTRDRPFGAKLELGLGYYHRGYDAPFQGRDLRGPTGSAGLLFDLSRRVSLDVAYTVSALSADETPEVLLLHEPDFGQDLNGDGSADDLDVRTVQVVDRSRTEHALATELDLDLAGSTDVRLSYEYRLRDFMSEQPYDVLNRDRRDTRHSVGLDVSFRLARELRLALGGELTSQGTNRAGDPGSSGEIDDYTRARTALKLAYRL